MVQLWVVLCLIIAATMVSGLGAFFSIIGLGKLFSGAALSIWLMAGSLELAKFTMAAFLHQAWPKLNFFFKSYVLIAVVVLSGITSMGIFGFLSGAYQESSAILEAENIKLDGLKGDQARFEAEIVRINKSVEEIPNSRITKKMAARAEAEPVIRDLRAKSDKVIADITEANLKILDVKNKVGPLIYIAKLFSVDVDTIVRYLIGAFVFVFDPLAICLVIAVSFSLALRASAKKNAERVAAGLPPIEDVPEKPAIAPGVVKMRFSKPPGEEAV